jgi:hypothetical protein
VAVSKIRIKGRLDLNLSCVLGSNLEFIVAHDTLPKTFFSSLLEMATQLRMLDDAENLGEAFKQEEHDRLALWFRPMVADETRR